MKILNKIPVSIIIAVLLLVGIAMGFRSPEAKNSLGAGGQNTSFSSFSNQTVVLASASASTLLLATSSSRQYALVTNDSTSTSIYLGMTGGGPARAGDGVMLRAGGSYEIKDVNLYTGAIYVIGGGNQTGSTTIAAKQ